MQCACDASGCASTPLASLLNSGLGAEGSENPTCHAWKERNAGAKKRLIKRVCACVLLQGPYGNDCSQSILSNPPANMSKSVSPSLIRQVERVVPPSAVGVRE
jgi:hypothetical protein